MPLTTLARGLACLVFIVAIVGCSAETPAPAAGPSVDDIATIRQMDAQFRERILAKDWPNLAKLYADKAVLMPPNAHQVMGAPAIAEWFASASGTVHEFTTMVEAIGGSGIMAISRGTYKMVFTPLGATETVTEPGKYLWVLQRLPDKSWRITAAAWNSDTAK